MTQASILTRLQSIFDDVFMEPVTVTPELSAKDVSEWDSFKHIVLVLAIEKAFGISFRVGEVESTKNIGEFANLIATAQAR
jgi:acyl carrier protein